MQTSASPKGNGMQTALEFGEKAVSVYLAQPAAFDNYCNGCEKLVAAQEEEVEGRVRVFCSEGKCVKA